MRAYILSQHEREMLQKYIQTGEKSYGFDVLKKRIRDNFPQIIEDIDLIKKTIANFK